MNNMKDYNQQIIADFRANGGKVSGDFAGSNLLLLTTTGAKSGQPRVSPLVFTRDGDHIVIIASKGGAPTNPDWYHNITANPVVTVEVGTESFQARASEATGEERDRIYNQVAKQLPGFAAYQEKTTRIIPVILLDRAE